ncbi:MAG: ABC transporter substrate-binding protein [Lachnospiraceae bacterium]|jgi:ABC-type transport system substrate-binding protein|nr:ABC transporter substrate-binding protein [Lachnospiraceae bacterium]
MKKTKRVLSLALALLLGAAVISGCATKSAAPADTTAAPAAAAGEAPAASQAAPADTQAAAPAAPEVGSGEEPEVVGATVEAVPVIPGAYTGVVRDVVNVGISGDVGDWNPFIFGTPTAELALQGMYQYLAYNFNGQLYPCLMKEYSFSDDGLTIYGELFDYIHDSAGNPLTAADVAWSYQMNVDMGGTGIGDVVQECVATGDYTFEFHLKEKLQVGRLDKICKFYIVTKAAYEASKDEMHTTPVGTGPYKLVEYTSGSTIKYEATGNYWQTDPQYITRCDQSNVNNINYYIISESSQRAIALQNGTIDMCMEVANEDLKTFESSDKYRVYPLISNYNIIVAPNCDASKLTADVNLRLAICYAISSEAILESVFAGNGNVNHEMSPSWAAGYLPQWDGEENYYLYDPAKAAEYLAKSSYNGEELTILCNTTEDQTNTAQLIMSFLSAVGIKSTMLALEDTSYRDYLKVADKWDIALRLAGTNTYYLDFIYGEMSKAKSKMEGTWNFAIDDELQDLINFTVLQENATPENIEKLHEYLIEHCYQYSTVNYMEYKVVPEWVSGVSLSMGKIIVPGGCVYTQQ